jgi:hypothetical protein
MPPKKDKKKAAKQASQQPDEEESHANPTEDAYQLTSESNSSGHQESELQGKKTIKRDSRPEHVWSRQQVSGPPPFLSMSGIQRFRRDIVLG